MRNPEGRSRVLGGLALLVVLACSSSATPRADARADSEHTADGGPAAGNKLTATSTTATDAEAPTVAATNFAGSHRATDNLCEPDLDMDPHERNSAARPEIAGSGMARSGMAGSGMAGSEVRAPADDEDLGAAWSDARGPEDQFGDQLCDDRWTPPPFRGEQRLGVAVDTQVHPGSPSRQTARVTNTGNTLLVGLVVGLDVGSCVRGIGLLEPGSATTVSCSGPAPETGRAAAEVLGRSPLGTSVSAKEEAAFAPPPAPPPPPHPEVKLVIGRPRPVDGNRPAEVPVRLTNPSPVGLHHIDITGFPEECARSFDRIGPGQSVAYDCHALPGSTVDLTVSARTADGFLPEGTVVTASAHAPVPAAPPPSTGNAPPPLERPEPAPAPPPEPVSPPQPTSTESEEGPLASPARTAGFISVAAVLVMLVSVGALSTATRPGK